MATREESLVSLTHRTRLRRAWIAAAAVLLALVTGAASPAEANWLTRLARGAGEAGEAGGRAASHGISALDRAASHIKALPPERAGPHAFAVHATQEGHWKFVNSTGEVFTAGTPEELARAIPTLSAGATEVAAGKVKPALYVTESTAFEQRTMLKDLPKDAQLNVVVGNEGYPLVRKAGGAGEMLYAEVRPNIIVELSERRAFDEAVWQLQRPLNKADVRVVSLTPGGPETLASVPRYDAATRAALVDSIDPNRLVSALSSLRRQTVLITGRTENGLLHFQPASGPSRSLVLEDLTVAAERADVNLIILESPTPRQPGGRNWLWQRIEVSGLDEAMKRATFADFLNALGATRGQLAVTAHAEASGRVVVRTMPSGAAAAPGSLTSMTGIAEWIGDVTAEATGRVIIHGAHAYVRSQERQQELDNRIVPGIPAWIQGIYLGSLLSGVIGWQVASGWWRRLWPAESRSEYPGRLGYGLARLVRGTAFGLVFLPVVGIPAMFTTLALGFWEILKMPGRLVRRLGALLGGSKRPAA